MPGVIKNIRFERLLHDHGQQKGWVDVTLRRASAGLILTKFGVYISEDGGLSVGPLLVIGQYAASRYSGIVFTTPEQLKEFISEITTELLLVHPELGRER